MNKIWLSALLLCVALISSAQNLRLPTVIGSGMVLQQNENVNIWGWAKPAAKVSVKPEWSGKEIQTKADADGRWQLSVATPAGSYKPYKIAIRDSKSEIILEDVLIGEVWLCSGQSNMAWRVKQVLDFKNEKRNAETIGANIRLYSTGRISEASPQDDVPGTEWQRCTPETVSDFSAVGYGFGIEIQKALDVPVGLIQAAYGGTLLEGWVSPDAVQNGPKSKFLQKSIKIINKKKGKWAGKESHLWNANIHPILNTRIAGVIWYQGCANVTVNPISYRETLQGLIESWRQEFNNPGMPFYIAQIAPHTYNDVQGALLRESQAVVAERMNDCGLVATIDNQEIPGDIHPRLKKDVSHRFALCALGQHYKKDVGEWRSPAYDSMTVVGQEIIVSFRNLPGTLKVKGDKIIGFQIGEKDADGSVRYVLADARIDDSGKNIVLSSTLIKNPTDVRYCFDESVGNVFAAEGLPLLPFRTDKKNMPVAKSARAYVEPAVDTPITFEGKGYTKVTLKDAAGLWSDSKMALYQDSYPKEFEGFEMLISDRVPEGGSSLGGKIIAQQDGRVYFIARVDKETRKTWYKGWRMIVPSELSVRREIGDDVDGSPKYKTSGDLYIHYMDVRKGDVIDLHKTGSWSGVIPVASSINYVE